MSHPTQELPTGSCLSVLVASQTSLCMVLLYVEMQQPLEVRRTKDFVPTPASNLSGQAGVTQLASCGTKIRSWVPNLCLLIQCSTIGDLAISVWATYHMWGSCDSHCVVGCSSVLSADIFLGAHCLTVCAWLLRQWKELSHRTAHQGETWRKEHPQSNRWARLSLVCCLEAEGSLGSNSVLHLGLEGCK